jgi:hypothetical protein
MNFSLAVDNSGDTLLFEVKYLQSYLITEKFYIAILETTIEQALLNIKKGTSWQNHLIFQSSARTLLKASRA